MEDYDKIDNDTKTVSTHRNNVFGTLVNFFKHKDEDQCVNVDYGKDDITKKEEDYQITICQDGKFVATFDTENLRIKLLKNTNYRPFKFDEKINFSNQSDEIDETIAYFKINNDFIIEKFYNTDYKPPLFEETQDDNDIYFSDSDEITAKDKKNDSKKGEKNDEFKWSFDMSNIYKKNDDEFFVFIAISRINIREDMKNTKEKKKDDNKKHEKEHLSKISFKCVNKESVHVNVYENMKEDNKIYSLEKMELETTVKRVKEEEDRLDNFIKKDNNNIYDNFIISRLHLCYTQGNNIIKLYCMENGLQVASKKFDEIEKIHLLEFIDSDEKLLIIGEDFKEDKDSKKDKKKLKFIVWDLYDTGKYELTELPMTNLENIDTRLAKISGNVLQIDDKGKVSSVLEKIEEVKKKKLYKVNKVVGPRIKLKEDIGKKLNGSSDEKHIIHYIEKIKFEPIVNDKEPWVSGDYERNSYRLYQHEEIEILQLIIGRSTVQIWHQIKDSNKGEPFLEYIWTNRILINQEREQTKLRIEKFEMFESNSKTNDFYLKVYWYERKDNEESTKEEEDEEICHIEDKIEEINKVNKMDEVEKEKRKQEIINSAKKVKRCEKVIQQKDIIEKFYAVRHACKALEHLNKRYINKELVDNYVRVRNYEEMITYIKHIIWKFVKYEPQNIKLLDVRYNIMKNLILGDCDDLIKFILFGDDKTFRNKNKDIVHIPSNKLWLGKKFLRDDDLDFDEVKDNPSIENKEFELQNNMELAMYHCKDKDSTIVAYLLEYYSSHAVNDAGWMCTVSKEIPMLFEYNYDDYAEKLFYKECFEGQTHDSLEVLEESYNKNFNAFGIVKLKSESLKHKKFKLIESPLLRIIPLPSFIKSSIKKKKEKYDFFNQILNIILFLLIPRWYKINQKEKFRLSPFSRMLLCGNDVIYDNPAIEAVINFPFAHTMFVLLRNPVNIRTKDSTYSGVATNSLTNETLNIEFKSDFDPTSSDNPFTSFSSAIMATYFWITNHIADYDAMYHIHFWIPDSKPKCIYYIGQSENYEDWHIARKDDDKSAICKGLKENPIFTNFKERDFDDHSIWNYQLDNKDNEH
ncbi:671_t:CDS:10 [Rhizophagus irregularis]|nr:671_t:CDS:10 [Rhizophagus irregularis]